jgi:glycosyltransferase involved in cell wall biosynthesis
MTARLTVSVVTGVIVYRDAISNVCRQQVEALTAGARARGLRLDLKIYTHGAHVPDSRLVLAQDPWTVAADPHFQESDLVLFQFGIYYPLFDAILLAPRAARVLACFQGITPPALLGPEHHDTLRASFRQAVNLRAADCVIVSSGLIRNDAIGLGVPADRVVSLPLAGSFQPPDGPVPGRPERPGLAVLYVGRFVPSKGVHDLIAALRLARADLPQPLTVALVGSRTFSDAQYLTGLQDAVRDHGLGDIVRFRFDVSDCELTREMLAADVLVMPSYHEGFCVPVVEALSCGTAVICADAGALPETSGGLGLCYPVGDAAALAGHLRAFAAARAAGAVPTDGGVLRAAEWRSRVEEYLRPFSFASYQQAFCEIALDGLTPADDAAKRELRQARCELLRKHGGAAELVRPADDLAGRLARTAARLRRA